MAFSSNPLLIIADLFQNRTIDPNALKEKPEDRSFASMWKLAQLRLFILGDLEDHPMFYSKQTDFLADKIFERIWKLQPFTWLPESLALNLASEMQRVDPEDTKGKIEIIEKVLSTLHQFSHLSDERYGRAALSRIKDIWRYIVIKEGKNAIKHETWWKTAEDFYERLGNLNLKQVQ